MHSNDPFSRLPSVPDFTVVSANIRNGESLPIAQYSGIFGITGGQDISPQLSWSGAPEGTKSYAVTVYDPDAPTGSGFWHWVVVDIPATISYLDEGAGNESGSLLPAGAFQLPNDARAAHFIGAAPPAGHGVHHYYVTVHALDIATVEIPRDSTPAFLSFNMTPHVLGRATLVATSETSA